MTDERRERFRTAVYQAIERGDDPADEAMAVADEENARVEVRRQEAIHALDAANATVTRLRSDLYAQQEETIRLIAMKERVRTMAEDPTLSVVSTRAILAALEGETDD
ncbi:hypothetical protein ACFYMO_00720 [Streptomyces sp. NPDC007025]|uniref:hypothetical protein n=1 Tax=Streptomyces sp. NPDC007025 TaxID=3364771 RepID=UPI00367C94C1